MKTAICTVKIVMPPERPARETRLTVDIGFEHEFGLYMVQPVRGRSVVRVDWGEAASSAMRKGSWNSARHASSTA